MHIVPPVTSLDMSILRKIKVFFCEYDTRDENEEDIVNIFMESILLFIVLAAFFVGFFWYLYLLDSSRHPASKP
uniref:Uncharacterized protein n=1 Tax=Panagrellus redivivus TaxID=6233 RepID=A0A7E4W3E2_PANRE